MTGYNFDEYRRFDKVITQVRNKAMQWSIMLLFKVIEFWLDQHNLKALDKKANKGVDPFQYH